MLLAADDQPHPREVGNTKTNVNTKHYTYVLNSFSFEVALVVQVLIIVVDELSLIHISEPTRPY